MSYIDNHRDIPKIEHWAIITTTVTHIPGDERSRTNPGHGYPAHDESSIKYQVFTEKSELIAEIHNRQRRGDTNYRVVKVTPVDVSITTKVEIAD